jgi:two-component system cell cycle sensor histidine kinase/response regulator CckA
MARRQSRMSGQAKIAESAHDLKADVDKQPLRILLVDDDKDDYVITSDLLTEIRGEKFNLEWVDTYEIALTAMAHNQHDVYLIDYRLGEHTGLELISEAIEDGCTAPLILLTGQGDRAVDVEAMKRGAADYLVKSQIDAPLLERSIRYAIERKQTERAMQRLAEQRKRLLEVSQSILSTLTLNEIIDQIEQVLQKIVRFETCGIYWLNEETSSLRSSYVEGKEWISKKLNEEIMPLKEIVRVVIESAEGQLLNNIHRDPRFVHLEGSNLECEHLISIPIRTKEKTLGVFNMLRKTEPPFTDGEFELVQLFVAQATNAIENARLHAETEKRARQLAVLHEMDRAITTSLRISDVYHAFSRHAIRLLPYDRTSITLLEGDEMCVTYVTGEEDETMPPVGTTLSRKTSIPGRVVTQGQPLLRHHIATNNHSAEDEPLGRGDIQSSMIIPLRVKGQVIGTWNLGSRQTGSYNPDDLDIAQAMADQLAIAIDNARLFEQAKQEITERKRVEEALRESEEKYRTLIERMSEGLLQVDNDDVIQLVNDRFCEMVGYSRDELVGKAAFELLWQENDQEFAEEEHPFTSEILDQREIQLKKKSGEIIWVQIGVAPVVDADNKVIGSVIIHTDITERKRAEETRAKLEDQLRQSQKMEAVGTLAGGIAHDFNNLLTAIMGYSGLALDELPPDDPRYNDIQGIQKTAQRAADLTRQLLAFARRQVVEPRILDLNELILNMGKMLRRLIGEDIELVILPDSNPGLVKVDPGQFEQVLVNLAINARDAMPNGGKLIIETANVILDLDYIREHAEVIPGEYVMLAVSDNGVGMTEEIKFHIFEPFFTTKEVDRGTGLGLATCFGIVKQSNGHIWVYSEPGQGTTFKVYLPRVDKEKPDFLFRYKEFSDLPRGSETVLLVEDEEAVRNLVGRILREQGYRLLVAANGNEALQLAQNQPNENIHLVVADVVMPQMGGKALIDQLKMMRPDIKVLFISGYTDKTIVHHGLLESGIPFLQKPFSPDKLVRKVREVLDEGLD